MGEDKDEDKDDNEDINEEEEDKYTYNTKGKVNGNIAIDMLVLTRLFDATTRTIKSTSKEEGGQR